MNAGIAFGRVVIRLLAIAGIALLPFISLNAQSVFSVNAVGYADANFVAGSNLIANPFFAADNTLSNLFRELPDGASFLPWHRGTSTFGPTNHYTVANGWSDPRATLVAPDGGFLVLPVSAKISFAGQLWTTVPGPGCVNFPAGDSVWSLFPLASCGIMGGGSGLPNGMSLAKWSPALQQYNLYTSLPGGQWDPSEPQLAPFEAALFSSPSPFSARSPFLGTVGGGTPVPTSLPWVNLQNPQRRGSNLTFQWPSANNVNCAVFCSTNLNNVSWQLAQQGTIAPVDGMATVTVSSTNDSAFYRVFPNFGSGIVLLGGERRATEFSFQFYASVATNYTVERVMTPGGLPWEAVKIVTAGPSNIVSVVDTNATASSGYYRVRY